MPQVKIWTVLFNRVGDEGPGVDVHGSHQAALDAVRQTLETYLTCYRYDAQTAQAIRSALDADDVEQALALHNGWDDADGITIEGHVLPAATTTGAPGKTSRLQ